MEELIGLLPVIIIAVVSAISKNAKSKQTQQHPYQTGSAAHPQQARPVSQPAAQPVVRTARPQQPGQPAARPVSVASPRQPSQPRVAQPTVHTHLDPDCEVHDSPASGSLNVRSPEGRDPCHEEQMPRRRAPVQEQPADQPSLALDWSGEAMVRAFVMQEVLTRPCDRRR